MNILMFIEEFLTEESCKNHFKVVREHEGLTCKRCESTNHYLLQVKWE